MKDILILINNDFFLRLVFVNATHPTKVHYRAEHWYFYYNLKYKDQIVSPFLFSDSYYYNIDKNILILEAYDNSIQSEEKIEFDSDVCKHLVIIDFNNMKFAKCSIFHDGHYKDFRISESILKYNKVKYFPGKIITQDTELNLNDLKWENFLLTKS